MASISSFRTIAFSAFIVLLGFAAHSQAEAQGRQRGTVGRDGPSRGGGGIGVPSVVPNLVIQGVIGTLAKQKDDDDHRRKPRRPRRGKLTDGKSKPRCGVRGRQPCPGKTASEPKCHQESRGRWRCRGTPSGGARIPPVIVLPVPAPDKPPPRTYATREERAPPDAAAAQDRSVERQVLVLVGASEPAATEGQIAQAHSLSAIGGAEVPLLAARAQVYRIDDQRPVQTVIAALTSDPRVMLVQRNMIYQRQAGAAGAARAAQYALDMIGAESAHELATGRGVKVAVIDSGVDQKHRDLEGAVSEAFDATGSKDAAPDIHGTAVAGIIRARGLVAGVAPDAKLLAVRAFFAVPKRDLPESTSFIVLRALDWSVRHGAQVINLSFSGGRDPVMERAVTAAVRRNVILVAAAGNGGPKAAPSYPAAYPDVIAVTALDSTERLYAHANHGEYISFAAPGVDILVPALRNGHMFMSGTSMAAAYVSGIMALLLERDPQLRPEDALRVLADTAEDLGSKGHDESFGAGRVQARAALDVLLGRAKAVGARQ